MSSEPDMIRASRFREIAELIRARVDSVIREWIAAAEQQLDSAKWAHREQLRNELPGFLTQMAHELASHGQPRQQQRTAAARSHGRQRWQAGWELQEVVQDYQLLRMVLLDILNAQLDRKLNLQEIQAMGLFLDDAIQSAITRYVEYQQQYMTECEDRSRGTFENADNLTVTPSGDLLVCEDGPGEQRLLMISSSGVVQTFARNALPYGGGYSELAGACFSPCGNFLFLNIRKPGMTLVIKGDW